MSHGKKYQEKAKLVESEKLYTVAEAIVLVLQTSRAKFPESVDISMKLGVDLAKNESVRGTVSPPHGTGKTIRIGVITSDANIEKAQKAGAAIAGGEDLIEQIKTGFTGFDVLLATPDMMPKIARLGKILGGKGLMPNPKSGTVVKDVEEGVGAFQKGRMEFRMDKGGVVHAKIGSVKFTSEMLEENLRAVVGGVLRARPSSVKGQFLRSVSLSTTMGPGIHISVKEFIRG